MIPNSKISQTILAFGKPVLEELPESASRREYECIVMLLIATWNAVVVDGWEGESQKEEMLLARLKEGDYEFYLLAKRLVKRKKSDFAYDMRAVGTYGFVESDGEFVFQCEARLDLDKIPLNKSVVH